ncbi:MAG: RlmE family RNA methyltransferase [Pseudomonadota bacterium]|nr:RlmE family RNA methyltransferase [Pseudomonadota bacterium]
MKPTRTSRAWMREHVNDVYVQRAKREGYRSRASFKLIEIDDRDRLLRPGAAVVDLGAAPGGWSQVARMRLGRHGSVHAIDILPMEPLPEVDFVQADFTSAAVRDALLASLPAGGADLVLSDLAPNMSGVELKDQARVMELAGYALEFALLTLKPEGSFLVKVFMGEDFDDFVRQMRASFAVVATRKPDASRGRSPEVYLLGRQPKPAAVEAARQAVVDEQENASLPEERD